MENLGKKDKNVSQSGKSSVRAIEEGSIEWLKTFFGTIYCKKAQERLIGFPRTVYTIDLEIHGWDQPEWVQSPLPGTEIFESPNQSSVYRKSTSESHAVLLT